ncbi:hypothetical protein UlMin_007535 [Ulmus minor]
MFYHTQHLKPRQLFPSCCSPQPISKINNIYISQEKITNYLKKINMPVIFIIHYKHFNNYKTKSTEPKFLVLDEADRVLDVGFDEELRVVFQSLPSTNFTLLEVSANKEYFYEAYEGFKTVGTLKEQYLLLSRDVKDVYLAHVVSCQLLSLLLEEIGHEAAALHSMKSRALRLYALHQFKSGQAPILITPILIPTDIASRALDIPTVDLVINYNIPRLCSPCGACTARAGRRRLAVSFVSQYDVELIQEIEAVIEKQLESFKCKENEVLADIKKVHSAQRVALMKMRDDGFEEKTVAEKGLFDKRSEKRKR